LKSASNGTVVQGDGNISQIWFVGLI